MTRNLKTLLVGRLKPRDLDLVHRSYDVIGDIAVVRLPKSLQKHGEVISEAIMSIQKNVKTVLGQKGPVSGEFRLRKLEWIAGIEKTVTVYKEHGSLFKVDLENCFFSPRLSYERIRITENVQPGEVIINMFAGVGCYSIIIAKSSYTSKVYSIDINPMAVLYMQENILLNNVAGRVIPIQGDSRKIVETNMKLHDIANRVLLPLPERALEYLDVAVRAAKAEGAWIHYYDFEHAAKGENPIEKVKPKVMRKLEKIGVNFRIPSGRIVRKTGPNWYQVVLDIKVKKPRI